MAGKRYAFMLRVLGVMCSIQNSSRVPTAVSPWRIIERVGVEKEDQVYVVLRKLVKKGLAKKVRKGLYVVNEEVCESLPVLEALLS